MPVRPNITARKVTFSRATPADIMEQGCTAGGIHLVAPVTTGETQLSVKGRVLHEGTLRPGMLRLCHPDRAERRLVRRPLEVMVFDIPAEQLSALAARVDGRPNLVQETFDDPMPIEHRMVRQLIGSAVFADKLPAESRMIFIEGLAEALLGLLLAQHERAAGAASKSAPMRLSERQLRECVAFAEERLDSKISVTEWADVLHLSASEFGRRFQRNTGLTPYAWFLDRRILRAQQLLREPGAVLCELALKLGFASQSHFTEAFRQHTGVSPSQWRKSRRDFETRAVS